jgi:ubiquinone/menaquinone biosynthesis C-methylase UbiE
MDYDKTDIPRVYDAGRAYLPEALALWLDHTSKYVAKDAIRRIIDVGCGTGRFSAALARHFDAEVIAVDRSRRMIEKARLKPALGVRYVISAAEALPLHEASADMVFMSMAFHHFDDPVRAVEECRRVLRPGGVVCLRTAITDRIANYPYVPFFRRSAAVLAGLLRSQSYIRSTFARAGFRLVRHGVVLNSPARNWAEYADRLSNRAIAALATLTEQEFDDGLSAIRCYAATAQACPVVEPIDFFCFAWPPRGPRAPGRTRNEVALGTEARVDLAMRDPPSSSP